MGLTDLVQHEDMEMTSYTGDKLDISGNMRGELFWRNKSHRTKIIVTEQGRNLLGLENCNKLGIVVWPERLEALSNKNLITMDYSFYINASRIFFRI